MRSTFFKTVHTHFFNHNSSLKLVSVCLFLSLIMFEGTLINISDYLFQNNCGGQHQPPQQQQPDMATEATAETAGEERSTAASRAVATRDTAAIRTARRPNNSPLSSIPKPAARRVH